MSNTEHNRLELVQRYVTGKMDAQEASEFEMKILDNDELLEEIELAQSINFGLKNYVDDQPIMAKRDNTVANLAASLVTRTMEITYRTFSLSLVATGAISATVFSSLISSSIDDAVLMPISFESVRGNNVETRTIKLGKMPDKARMLAVKVPEHVLLEHNMFQVKLYGADRDRAIWDSSIFEVNNERIGLVSIPKHIEGQMSIRLFSDVKGALIEVDFCSLNSTCL